MCIQGSILAPDGVGEYIQECAGVVYFVIGDLVLRRQFLFFTNNLKNVTFRWPCIVTNPC